MNTTLILTRVNTSTALWYYTLTNYWDIWHMWSGSPSRFWGRGTVKRKLGLSSDDLGLARLCFYLNNFGYIYTFLRAVSLLKHPLYKTCKALKRRYGNQLLGSICSHLGCSGPWKADRYVLHTYQLQKHIHFTVYVAKLPSRVILFHSQLVKKVGRYYHLPLTG